MTRSPKWSQATKQLIYATLLILAGLLMYNIRGILGPLVITALLAYIFAPLVGWLSRHLHIGRALATALVYLVGLGLLATAPAIAVPAIVNQVSDLVVNLDSIIRGVINWLEQTRQIEILGYVVPLPAIDIQVPSFSLENIISLIQGALSSIGGGAFSVVTTVGSVVGWLVFIAVLSFYLLVDAERVGPALLRVIPPSYRAEISKLGAQINRTWNSFLRGQILLMLFVGALTMIAMSALGVRFSIALGILAGLLEIIPSIGPFLSAVPAILIALFQGAANLPLSHLGAAIVVAGIYIFIQQIENNILVPRIIGSTLQLPSLIVIVGILAGATMWGILGALLAAPLLATLRDVLRYIYAKLTDMDPFPEPPPFAERVEARRARAILFDLDGTLLDTDNMVVEYVAKRLRSVPFLTRFYDSRRLARRIVMGVEGPLNAVVTLFDVLGLDNKILSWGEWLRAIYGQREPSQYLAVDGIVRLIQEANKNYDLAIITTRNRADTDQFMELFGLKDQFKAIVTRQDVRRLKPHAEPVQRAAQELGYSAEQCIVVGDTTLDIQAGKRAGALTVGVLCGFGEQAELERLEPDLILETTAHLARYLPNHRSAGAEST